MSEPYDPNSPNAMFSRIMERLDQQDYDAKEHRTEIKESLAEIRRQTTMTNGRVGAIEQWMTTVKAKIAVFVALGSILVSWVMGKFFK